MKDRMTLGHDADVAETAALTLADPDAERRMFDELDRETDRAIWLKVANEIGYEAFLELYREQKSILDDCRARGNPLRHPAAAFQARLNRYTGHGKQKGGAA